MLNWVNHIKYTLPSGGSIKVKDKSSGHGSSTQLVLVGQPSRAAEEEDLHIELLAIRWDEHVARYLWLRRCGSL